MRSHTLLSMLTATIASEMEQRGSAEVARWQSVVGDEQQRCGASSECSEQQCTTTLSLVN